MNRRGFFGAVMGAAVAPVAAAGASPTERWRSVHEHHRTLGFDFARKSSGEWTLLACPCGDTFMTRHPDKGYTRPWANGAHDARKERQRVQRLVEKPA